MSLAREVAEAYIEVHGDMSPFRRDLEKLTKQARDEAIKTADGWAEGLGKRMQSKVKGQWASIQDAFFSGDPMDWDRVIGKFDSANLEDARAKMKDFAEEMTKAGKFGRVNAKAYNDLVKEIDRVVNAKIKLKDLTEKLAKQEQEEADAVKDTIRYNKMWSEQLSSAFEEAIRDNKAWNSRRAQTMAEAIRDNEKYNRSFDGLVKNMRRADLEGDFKRISEAIAKGDWENFAKGFDGLDDVRRRVNEVTDAMVEQSRISRENAFTVRAGINAYIEAEERRLKAVRDALDATKEARLENERFKRSMDGMVQAAGIELMERRFRDLATAIASNDFSRIARAHTDVDSLTESVRSTALEMRRLGRISDAGFDAAISGAQRTTTGFKQVKTAADAAGDSFDRNNRFIALMGRGLDNVVGKVRGLAGFNVVLDVFREGGEFIQNIDRNAVKIAKMVTLIGGLGGVVVSSLAGALTIVDDIAASFAGLAALGPAFLTGAGIAIGVAVAAFKDMKTVLKDLGPQFNRLQDVISKRFWEQAETPIRNLVDKLMPTLNEQVGNTADAMGGLMGAFADGFAEAATAERVTVMFERLNEAITIAQRAMAPLTRAFVNLGETGSKYFTRFAEWIVKLSEQFDAFIQKAKDSGDLDRWIENAIQGFKDMGSIIWSTGRMFGSLSDAARDAGSKGLSGFAENMRKIADFMESPRFQKAMTEVFKGFYTILDGVADATKSVGRGLEAMIPTFTNVAGSIKEIFKTLGGYLEQFLKNPVLQDGISKFAAGIEKALKNLAPAIDPMAKSLGGLFSLMADVLPNITALIADITVKWGPSFDKLLEAIKPLIGPVTDLAKVFIDKMSPVLDKFVTEVLPPLVELFIQLLPSISALVRLLSPVLLTILDGMATTFKNMAAALKDFNRDAGPVITKIGQIADAAGKIKLPKEFDGGGLIGNIGAKFGIALGKEVPWTLTFGKWIEEQTRGIRKNIERFKDIMESLFNPAKLMVNVGKAAAWFENTFIKPIKEGVEKAIKGFEQWRKDIKTNFQKMMANILGFGDSDNDGFSTGGASVGGRGMGASGKLDPSILGLPSEESTKSWFESFGETLSQGITGALGRLGEALGLSDFGAKWSEFWSGLPATVQTAWDAVSLWVTTKYTEISTNIATWIEQVKLNWNTFWDSLGTKVGEAWNAMVLWITTKYTEISTNIGTFIAEVSTNWNNFWTGIYDKVVEIWNTVKAWIETKVNEIKAGIDKFVTDVRTNWDNFWSGVNKKVQEIWNAVTSFIGGKVAEIRGRIDGFISGVRGNWDNFWSGVRTTVSTAWENMRQSVAQGVENVMSFITGLPGRISGALGGLGGLLIGAGNSIMQGFLSGLRSSWGAVTDFVGGIASWIAANKGPLPYDRRLLVPAGQAIMGGLESSMRDKFRDVMDFVSSMADEMAAVFEGSRMYAAGKDAAAGLTDGLLAGRGDVAAAYASLGNLPALSANVGQIGTVSANVPGTDGRTSVPGGGFVLEKGAIQIVTPTKNPEIVASKVIDGFADFSKF